MKIFQCSWIFWSSLVSKPNYKNTPVFVCLEKICQIWCFCQASVERYQSQIQMIQSDPIFRSFSVSLMWWPKRHTNRQANANHPWAQEINGRSRFVVGFVASSIGPGGLHHCVQSTHGCNKGQKDAADVNVIYIVYNHFHTNALYVYMDHIYIYLGCI